MMHAKRSTPESAPVNPDHATSTANEWAVASAYKLLGQVSPTALVVAAALASFVPFDGSHLTAWPSWKRLMEMCRIGSKHRLQRTLWELEGVGAIRIKRGSRRRSQEYTLLFVEVPSAIRRRAPDKKRKRIHLASASGVRAPQPQPALYPAPAQVPGITDIPVPPKECGNPENERDLICPSKLLKNKEKAFPSGAVSAPLSGAVSAPPTYLNPKVPQGRKERTPQTPLGGATSEIVENEGNGLEPGVGKDPSTMETVGNRIGKDRGPEPIPQELRRAAESYSLIVRGRTRSEVVAAYRGAAKGDRENLERTLSAISQSW